MFNNACKYAIRAVLYLGLHSDPEQRFGARHLSDQLDVPQPFLAQLLRQLTSGKVISSARGPGGGFFLSREDRSKTLWDVVHCIDPDFRFDECLLGLARCSSTNPCPLHTAAKPYRERLLEEFKGKSQSELAQEIRENGTVISLKGLIK